MPDFLIAHALKSMQWERAKGELYALVALQGSYNAASTVAPGAEPPYETQRWYKLSTRVKTFVDTIENEGLHE